MYIRQAPFIPDKLTLTILYPVSQQRLSKSYRGSCESFRTRPTKIDSIQNVNLLRSDLHNAWGNYKLAVNPDICVSYLRPVSVFIIRSDSAGM